MVLDEQKRITVIPATHWDRGKTGFVWIDDTTLKLNAVIAYPECGSVSTDSPQRPKWWWYAKLSNGLPLTESAQQHCLEEAPSLDLHFVSSTFDRTNVGDVFKLELYKRSEVTDIPYLVDTIEGLTVPSKEQFELTVTFQVPNHNNVEIRSDDGSIQLFRLPYSCMLDLNKVYLFHIRTEGGLKRLADIRLQTTEDYTVECLELDGGSIWCGRQEAPGISVSSDNTITVYVGPEERTKEDVLATLQGRGFIPFTQLPSYPRAGGGWTRSTGVPEANYKKEWGDTTFEMWVSGVSNNPPNTTNAISWAYKDKTSDRECKREDPPTTGACLLRPLATALLDSAIDALYGGLPETLTACLDDTIPSEDISVDAGGQFQYAIAVTNWSWVGGKIRARIRATGEGVEPWEKVEESILSSMNSVGFNGVLDMPKVKYQLDFYAEHYDDDSGSWIIDDMKRVIVATRTTAMLMIHKAVDSNGTIFSNQENITILWDGGDCGIYPPADIIVGSGYYCDIAKLIETNLGSHIITVKKEGFTTTREEFEFVAGNTYEFTPIILKEGEEPVEEDMGSISEFHAMIVAKEAPINTFCNEETHEGICACSGTGSEDARRWCKYSGKQEQLEPMYLSAQLTLGSDKPESFRSWCGEYPTPDSSQEHIEEWWSIAIALAFKSFGICVQLYEQFRDFIPAVIKQIEVWDEVLVSTSEADNYDTPSPRRVYFPVDLGLTIDGYAMPVGEKKLSAVLLTKGPDGHFGQPQGLIGPFRYLESDLSEGKPPALLYRDWDIDGTELGGAIELQYWEDSNPPDASDIAFTEFYQEHPTTKLPLIMLEEAIVELPFMIEETYAKLLLMQAVDKNTGEDITADVWWDDCECGGYGSDWAKLIGPGQTLGTKKCKADFEIHTITIKKKDYADFSITLNFKPGNEYLVTPELVYTGEGEVSADHALFIINPAKIEDTGWDVTADIYIGEVADLYTFDTGKNTLDDKTVEIKFCNGCTFGTTGKKQQTKLNVSYHIDLRHDNYKDLRYAFKAIAGAGPKIVSPNFILGSYGAATIIDPAINPKNIYTDIVEEFIIGLVNTGDISVHFTTTIIFKGIDTDKVYSYESASVYVPVASEATIKIPIQIPKDAIPIDQDIANYYIDMKVEAKPHDQ